MPELPEVETTVRGLRKELMGDHFQRVEVLRSNMVHTNSDLSEIVRSKKIISIRRIGKYIIVDLENNSSLILHLKISGRLGIRNESEDELAYERIRFFLQSGKILVFNDPRTLGRVYSSETNDIFKHSGISKLGIDALEVDTNTFVHRVKNRSIPIKSLLLDQSFVAGIGNIYADEALFDAGIDPRRSANNISTVELKNLHASVVKVLKKGIENMGTSFSDFSNLFGKPGQNQQSLFVYGRAGEQCRKCGTILSKTILKTRGTTWCSRCQN